MKTKTQDFRKFNKMIPILAALIWFVLHLYIASQRSISSDEGAKILYLNFPFLKAIYMHLSEYAPYTPGEMILGWLLNHSIGMFFSLEIVNRIVPCLFGALTIWLAFCFSLEFKTLFLMPILFFSVSMTSFSTQFQPISSLIFAGTLFLTMSWSTNGFPSEKIEYLLSLLVIFVGHIFGVCFIGFGSLMKKKWGRVLASFFVVFGVLLVNKMIHRDFGLKISEFSPWTDVFKQTFSAMTNPHKASFFYLPLFILGLIALYQNSKKNLSSLITVLFFTILAPILVSYFSKYQFLPRYSVGGVFPVLLTVSLGYRFCISIIPKFLKKPVILLLWGANLFFAIGPWVKYCQGYPPFVDQPLHRLNKIIEELDQNNANQVLLLEAGMSGSYLYYLDRFYGTGNRFLENKKVKFWVKELGEISLETKCWHRLKRTDFCLYTVENVAFIFSGQQLVEGSLDFQSHLRDGKPIKFDALLHSFQDLKIKNFSIPIYRSW